MTDQTDHRAAAAQFYGHSDEVLDDRAKPMGASSAIQRAQFHLLAAIHDGQAEQTEWLHRIRDLLAVMAEPKGDPCPCGCRRDVEPKPHVHFWKRQQNVTSRGYAMDPIEVCECGAARKDEPEPETVTVTLPRDVVEVTSTVGWRANADMLRMRNFRGSAGLLDALADALDAASATQEADQ